MASSIVWITGASGGIGRALCETVPYDDARVIGVSRSDGTVHTEHLAADLADPSGWSAVDAHFRETLSAFDGDRVVLVHCAGTLDPMGFAAEVDAKGYRDQVMLNSASPQAVGQSFLSAAAGFAGEVVLVHITSGAAQKPYEGWSAYCAGKAAVDHWVRTVGAEQDKRGGARVLAVAPGTVDTAMQAEIRRHDESEFPAVGKFQGLYESGSLTDPHDAASGIWQVVAKTDDFPTGSVVDLRQLD